MGLWPRGRGLALVAGLLVLGQAGAAQAVDPKLVRDIRATKAELKGFGYLEIGKKRWCVVAVDAELAEPTTGEAIGETLFGSKDDAVCRTLWTAAKRSLRVDLTGIPERAVIERVFVGSARKIYPIGFVWVRTRKE